MRNWRIALAVSALALVPLAGCGGDDNKSSGKSASSGTVCADTNASGDELAHVCDTGKLVVSTDPAYPPQSSLDKKTGKYVGFDIAVATEIAKRLGVDVAWQTPSWDLITAGRWNGRWDISVGSMTPTNDRQKVLYFSPPYYYTPAVVVVHKDNTSVKDLSTDLDGKDIGVCSACTYEQYLDKKLNIKGFKFDYIIDEAKVHGYDTDTTALQDLSLGDGTRLDAVITSRTTAQGYVKSGKPVKIVGDPVFYEPLAVAMDRSAERDPKSLVKAVDSIVEKMHSDGTLTELSKKWYGGLDLSVQS
jgi:polar amino acid transport system substrate-binding protein